MNRLSKVALALGMITSLLLCALSVGSAGISGRSGQGGTASTQAKVMREYKGVKLGMKRAQVQATMGKPETSTDNSEDYKLGGDDMMTVHYDNDEVRAIQLGFYDPKNAPAWKDVVGDAEVSETESGAKHARKVVSGENFWVSIYQSKDGQTTRITISR
jgi:hypothetical protein